MAGYVDGPQYEQPIADAFEAAQRQGLIAGASLIRNEVRRRLRGGYLSSLGNRGDFVTGASVNHVAISTPVRLGGRLVISIGTDLAYNLFWEVGHHNIFTRHFERDEKWHPAFVAARPQAVAAFVRVVQRAMRGGGV